MLSSNFEDEDEDESRGMNMRMLMVSGVLASGLVLKIFAQGPLTPPGAPAAMMKTLDQVEPRIPITNLPYAVTNSGSYYLAKSLTGVIGQNGISISGVNGVSIDLMGFTLFGAPGSASGISVSSSHEVTIRNGNIRNWGSSGISGSGSRSANIEYVRVLDNAGNGIVTGSDSVIRYCVAEGNTVGFFNAGDGVLEHCESIDNDGDGIVYGLSGIVKHCRVYENGNRGIWAGKNSMLMQNEIVGNVVGVESFGNDVKVRDNRVLDNASVGLRLLHAGHQVSGNIVKGNADNYQFGGAGQLDLTLSEIPETIEWPARIELVGSLTGVGGTDGITLDADNVSIDLNGHVLRGAGPGTSSKAIQCLGGGYSIKNGIIENWGGGGIGSVGGQRGGHYYRPSSCRKRRDRDFSWQ